jgi:hypothetical protein
MQPEVNKIPDWAILEREQDRAWIRENVPLFFEKAVQGVRLIGRGAIVVDVTARPMGEGNLFSYFSQAEMVRFRNEQIDQFVQEYHPDEEFVIALLKSERRVSSYRIRPLLNNKDNNQPD